MNVKCLIKQYKINLTFITHHNTETVFKYIEYKTSEGTID